MKPSWTVFLLMAALVGFFAAIEKGPWAGLFVAALWILTRWI